PQNYPGLTIVTFTDPTQADSGLGSANAASLVPNLFGDGSNDLVIGEPNANLNGKTGNGGVWIFQTSSLPQTLGAANVVQVRSGAQFVISGANSGDQAGFSVASAGDVNDTTGINDLLIGAPGFNNNAGAAYLVYGGTTMTNGTLNGILDLSRLQITPV